jgi:hypothetical protein
MPPQGGIFVFTYPLPWANNLIGSRRQKQFMLLFINLTGRSKQFSLFRLVLAFLATILHQNQPHEPSVY